jgi:hypothetical protein
MYRYLKDAYPFGILGGLLCLFTIGIMYFMGKDPVGFTEIFGYMILPIFVFLGIKNFRDHMNGGELGFGQGMTTGFFVYSILALTSAIGIFIFLRLEPAIFEDFKSSNLILLEESKEGLIEQLDEESYKKTLNNILNMTVLDVAVNDFLRKIFPGLFITIIISIILKRTLD